MKASVCVSYVIAELTWYSLKNWKGCIIIIIIIIISSSSSSSSNSSSSTLSTISVT
jgi:hypothetical protein